MALAAGLVRPFVFVVFFSGLFVCMFFLLNRTDVRLATDHMPTHVWLKHIDSDLRTKALGREEKTRSLIYRSNTALLLS